MAAMLADDPEPTVGGTLADATQPQPSAARRGGVAWRPRWQERSGSASSPAAATCPASTPSSRASSTVPPRSGNEVLGIRRGWEGLTHVRPERRPGPRLPATARPVEHPDDRPDGRHHPAHLADEPAQDARRRPAALAVDTRPRPLRERPTDTFDLTPLVLEHLAALGIDVLVDHRRRRHAVVLAGARERGRPARRDPQDDGQRRPGHRVLHRVLDGDHPGQGGDQPAAHDARLARADRRVPDLRPGRRASPRCTRRTSRRADA